MSWSQKLFIQSAIAAVVALALLRTAPTAPARRLAVAIDYSYHRIVPDVARDGLN